MLSLECYQELSNQLGTIDRQQHLLVIGASRIPFVISARGDDAPSKCTVQFNVSFRTISDFSMICIISHKLNSIC